jgi:hypothetical protein
MFASYSGHAQVVKQLVNAGTNVDMQSQVIVHFLNHAIDDD